MADDVKQFRALVSKRGGKITVALPFDPNGVWGEKPRHYVTGAISGHPFRGAIVADGDAFVLSLGAAWRRDVGVEVGQEVAVSLAPEGPQLGALPPELVAALEAEPAAKTFFLSLATFYRKAYLGWINGARQPEARHARIAELIDLLKAGKKER
jgi:hypothetical protein